VIVKTGFVKIKGHIAKKGFVKSKHVMSNIGVIKYMTTLLVS